MKKIIKTTIITIIITSAILLSYVFCATKIMKIGAQKVQYGSFQVLKHGNNIFEEEKYEEVIVDVFTKYVPSKIVDSIYKDKVDVVVTDIEHFEGNYKIYGGRGATINNMITKKAEIIVIKSEERVAGWKNDPPVFEENKRVLCHEVGHYLDFKIDSPSQSQEWKEILEEEFENSVIYEKSKWDPDEIAYYRDAREYFAEAFAYVTYDKEKNIEVYEKMLTKCPKTIAYIEKIVDEF